MEIKKEWRKIASCFHNLHDSSKEDWYFDRGWPRHITENSASFYDLNKCFSEYVTFGDGAKKKVFGKGNFFKPNLPKLQDVRLFKCLLANLISISQLCD